MSNLESGNNNTLKPLLCETENENTGDIHEINEIPHQFSNYENDITEETEIETENEIETTHKSVKKIIDNLDHYNNNNNLKPYTQEFITVQQCRPRSHQIEEQYVTKNEFNNVVGDMRVDIGEMVGITQTVHRTSENNSRELTSLREENMELRKGYTEVLDILDDIRDKYKTKLEDLTITYDDKIDELLEKINELQNLDIIRSNITKNKNIALKTNFQNGDTLTNKKTSMNKFSKPHINNNSRRNIIQEDDETNDTTQTYGVNARTSSRKNNYENSFNMKKNQNYFKQKSKRI